MTQGTYFVQTCPICSRALHVRVDYLGREVSCQHCRGKFTARDPDGVEAESDDSLTLLQRADELLGESKIA